MAKFKVPIDGGLFELANGRQLVPGEVSELSADEAKENADLLKASVEAGTLFDLSDANRLPKGGDK